ncbi:MAG TPA: 16S rRNA (guanine(966)-N(2))-methyltransferase RsmD [Burkholderiales bacterium]|nr:16S rRNA (guanine(966)-N(2))-methyltransferase RsmD [Burkholderiales bacterium]
MRIIGGEWRSRVIRFTPVPGLRPTPDRVRETLFNWLGQDLSGRDCLDLFAGSGALGFEAASRGARTTVLVERDRAAWRSLEDNAARLGATGVQVVCADAFAHLLAERRIFDVVFLDPPFGENLLPRLLPLLPPRLAAQADVYVECARLPPLPPGCSVWRQGRAGKVEYALLRFHEPTP